MKRLFIHGFSAAFLSSLTGIIYYTVYKETLETAFDEIINATSIIVASTIGCMLMTIGYATLLKMKKQKLKGILNITISVLSFASIIGPISMTLPIGIEAPELFPGLVAPLHFFPALTFFSIEPFFRT